MKLECLRLLATLKLDPARTKLISGFIDTYLQLNSEQEQRFQQGLQALAPPQQEEVMEIVTSWLRQGEQKGLQQGESKLILRQLTRRFGALDAETQTQIQQLSIAQLDSLGDALLDFNSAADLTAWLAQHQAALQGT